MKKPAGILLIVFGLILIVWGAFGFTTREKVLDIGPLEATKETKHHVPYAPLVGAVVLIGGVVVLVSGSRS